MKNKKIIYVLSIVIIIFIIGFSFLIYKSEQSEKNRIQKQIELDLVYNELDSISILLGEKIITISKLGGEIDSLIIIKENIEKEKKEFRSRAFTQINRLQSKVEGYKELLIAQDEEINKLKLINEQLYDENKDQEKVNYASRIELRNLEIFGISKNGRNYKNSFKNRLVNKIKIDIEIEENEIAKIEIKDIYLRVKKPDGNLMFDISKGSGSFIFENRELFYTIKKEVLIDKLSKSLSVEYIKNEDFMIGNHSVTLYTDSYIIGKKEFLVK